MKYVLIWVATSGQGIATGSQEFESKENAYDAAILLEGQHYPIWDCVRTYVVPK